MTLHRSTHAASTKKFPACRSCRARLQRHNARRRKKGDSVSPLVRSASAVRKSSAGSASSRRGSATSAAGSGLSPQDLVAGLTPNGSVILTGGRAGSQTLPPLPAGGGGLDDLPQLMRGWGPLVPGLGGDTCSSLGADLFMQPPMPGTLAAMGTARSAGDATSPPGVVRPRRLSFDSSRTSSYDIGAGTLAFPGHAGPLAGAAGAALAKLGGAPIGCAGGDGHGNADAFLPGVDGGGCGGAGRPPTDQRVFVTEGTRNPSTQSTSSVFEPVSTAQLDTILSHGAVGGAGPPDHAAAAAGDDGPAPAAKAPSVLDEARGLLSFGGYQQPYSSDQQLVRCSAKCGLSLADWAVVHSSIAEDESVNHDS